MKKEKESIALKSVIGNIHKTGRSPHLLYPIEQQLKNASGVENPFYQILEEINAISSVQRNVKKNMVITPNSNRKKNGKNHVLKYVLFVVKSLKQ